MNKRIDELQLINEIVEGNLIPVQTNDGTKSFNLYNILKRLKIIENRCSKLDTSRIKDQYNCYSSIKSEIKDSDFSLAFCTDPHFNNSELRPKLYNSIAEIKMFNNVSDNLKINDKYILGDLLNGDYTNERLFDDMNEFKTVSKNCILIHGNHDDGSYIENLQIKSPSSYGKHQKWKLEKDEIFNWYYKDNNVTEIDEITMAFYKDYEKEKIRLIHVNTSDLPDDRNDDNKLKYNSINTYGISPRQVEWLNDHAFNFDSKGEESSEWKIIIISHIPLVENLAVDGDVQYPFYYGNDGYYEYMANSGIVRQMIRNINSGNKITLASYLTEVPTTDLGYYYKTIESSSVKTIMTADMHSDNYKYFGSRYSIDGTNERFSINFNKNSHKVPVIACISGHMHKDAYYNMGNNIHHFTLAGMANSAEDDTPDIEEYAYSFFRIKNNEIFWFRQGRNKCTIENPTLLNNVTNYGIEAFKNNRFLFE